MRHALHFLVIGFLMLFMGCGTDNNVQAQPRLAESPTAQETQEDASPAVDRELFLDEISPEDWTEICGWMVELQGGPHSVECGDGITVTIDTIQECSSRTEFPHCAVGLLIDCVDAQAEDLCGDAPAACDTFYTCVYGPS